MTAPVIADDPPVPRRAVCARCARPEVVCYCAHLPTLPTRTRVVLLQHPRERNMAIGTARMAHLALPNSVLRVGVDFAADPVVTGALGAAPSYLLFPGRDARDVADLPRDRPVNLVVLDGTWWQAGKLLKLNPILQQLPRVAFQPSQPSDYRIRRQPAPFCVSTIEALAEVLTRLEPDRGPFDALLRPFRAMIDRQQWYVANVRSQRHHHELRVPRVPAASARLLADWPHVLFVQGEANAWAKRDPARQPAEIVHWVAHRPASGETFEALVAPRRPLAPGTPAHTGLLPAQILAAENAEAWHARWRAFLRPDDVIVSWGRYYTDLAVSDGLLLPATGTDVRVALSQMKHQRAGSMEDWIAHLSLTPPALGLPGRAGRRLAALMALADVVVQPARDKAVSR